MGVFGVAWKAGPPGFGHFREEWNVKHLQTVSKEIPKRAELWQEFVCYGSQMVGDLISAMGGSKPLLGAIETKCDLPEGS